MGRPHPYNSRRGRVFPPYNSNKINLGNIIGFYKYITTKKYNNLFGVISSIRFVFDRMSAFDLIVILVLAVGGLGIVLRSFRNTEKTRDE